MGPRSAADWARYRWRVVGEARCDRRLLVFFFFLFQGASLNFLMMCSTRQRDRWGSCRRLRLPQRLDCSGTNVQAIIGNKILAGKFCRRWILLLGIFAGVRRPWDLSAKTSNP